MPNSGDFRDGSVHNETKKTLLLTQPMDSKPKNIAIWSNEKTP